MNIAGKILVFRLFNSNIVYHWTISIWTLHSNLLVKIVEHLTFFTSILDSCLRIQMKIITD